MTDKDKLNKIRELVTIHCDACREFEPKKSLHKFTCLDCNYGTILDILSDQKESEA